MFNFARLDPHVQRVSAWLTIGGVILSAVFALLASAAPYFQGVGWAGTILAGIGLALATMLVIALVLFLGAHAFRLVRPLPSVSPDELLPVLDHQPPAYDDTALRAEIADLNTFVEAVAEAVRKETDGKIEQVGGKLDLTIELYGGRLEKLEKGATATEKLGKQNEAGLLAALASMSEIQKFAIKETSEIREQVRFVEHDAKMAEDTREAEKNKLGEALYAIYNREILTKLAGQIEGDAAKLYDPFHEGQNYDEARWIEWEQGYLIWESALKVWVQNGQWYVPNLEARTFTIDDALYAVKWGVKDSQFPDTEAMSRSEAVRRFKKFRILYRQWQEIREEVDRGVIQVAFVGLSERDARQRPPKV